MRLTFAISLLIASSHVANSFTITGRPNGGTTHLSATTLDAPSIKTAAPKVDEAPAVVEKQDSPSDYNARLEAQLKKMKIKDATSKTLTKEVSDTKGFFDLLE
jgi:hypothetical protein